MEDKPTFSDVFSYYTYPVLGVLGDPLNNLKTPYSLAVAKTLINFFKIPENYSETEKTWNPRRQYWNVVNVDYDIEGYFSSLIDCTKERELILDETWFNKLQRAPAVLLSIHELSSDDSLIVNTIKSVEKKTNVPLTAVIILDQNQYEADSTDSRISEILKKTGLDSKHLAISIPGTKTYIKEFLGGLEGDLWVDSMLYYGSKISRRQEKISSQLSLIEGGTLSLQSKVPLTIEKPNIEKWHSSGRAKLIRHYIKQSYFTECCNESELKKICIKEAYRQIQLFLKDLSRNIHQRILLENVPVSQLESILLKDKHWCEAICIMNSLCVRMEREAIKEWQDSPRVQHLQNLLQVLQNSKTRSSFYSWYLLSQSMESLIPIHKLAYETGKGVPLASFTENINSRLLEISPVNPSHIGSLHYSIAISLYECAYQLEKIGIKSFIITRGIEPVDVTIESIWKKALSHSIESEGYYKSKLWCLRIDTMIADLLIKSGNTDLGLKKLRSVIEFYREQKWGKLLDRSLSILKEHDAKKKKFLCLLEISTIRKTKESVAEWISFLDTEDIGTDLRVDMNSILPVIICKCSFVKEAIINPKKSKFLVALHNLIPFPIKFKEISVELEPKSCGGVVLSDVELNDKRLVIGGEARSEGGAEGGGDE
ncbi:hypothetical protein AYI68_g6829 [Smittium mucronatum]|uniref:Trafficking protein particle complex subunit 11 domain-containing protein n=1 Tax=Smittium mucronatum TaxID=133383 RepID=A0A1R0GQF0_9FUNG|nr:hypothetical protein AYI68_g6829 [Smittium mucronatum]